MPVIIAVNAYPLEVGLQVFEQSGALDNQRAVRQPFYRTAFFTIVLIANLADDFFD